MLFIAPDNKRLKGLIDATADSAGFRFTPVPGLRNFVVAEDLTGEIAPFQVNRRRKYDALDLLENKGGDVTLIGSDSLVEHLARYEEQGLETAVTAVTFLPALECRLSVAVKKGSGVTEPGGLAGLRISTCAPATLRGWLKKNGVSGATVTKREGGVEDDIRLGVADAICDLVQSGATLRGFGLEEKFLIAPCSAVLVARRDRLEDPSVRALLRRLAAADGQNRAAQLASA